MLTWCTIMVPRKTGTTIVVVVVLSCRVAMLTKQSYFHLKAYWPGLLGLW